MVWQNINITIYEQFIWQILVTTIRIWRETSVSYLCIWDLKPVHVQTCFQSGLSKKKYDYGGEEIKQLIWRCSMYEFVVKCIMFLCESFQWNNLITLWHLWNPSWSTEWQGKGNLILFSMAFSNEKIKATTHMISTILCSTVVTSGKVVH